MAYTLTDYQAICSAIALGQRRVRYADKEVEYHGLDQLMKAKAAMEAELQATGQLALTSASGVERGGTTYAQWDAS